MYQVYLKTILSGRVCMDTLMEQICIFGEFGQLCDFRKTQPWKKHTHIRPLPTNHIANPNGIQITTNHQIIQQKRWKSRSSSGVMPLKTPRNPSHLFFGQGDASDLGDPKGMSVLGPAGQTGKPTDIQITCRHKNEEIICEPRFSEGPIYVNVNTWYHFLAKK